MQYLLTSNCDIESDLYRLDAEYHVGIAKINVSALSGDILFDLCEKIVQGPNPKFVEQGIPCLNGKNVYFGSADSGEPNYVTNEEYKNLKSYHLREYDILITLKHATRIGRAWVFKNNEKSIFSRNLGLIRLRQNGRLNFATLLFYLWGDAPQKLLNLVATGGTNGQITLSMAELKKFPVPIFSKELQDNIQSIYFESEQLINQSEKCYQQAQTLLLSELGLLDWKPKHHLSFVKNYSDTQQAGRFDAGYYQPKYDEIVVAIKSYAGGWDTLGNLVSVKKCIEVGSGEYSDEGIPFVRVSNLSPFEITEEKYISDKLYSELTPNEEIGVPFVMSKKHQPKKGEILFSKDATPGIANFLNEEPQKMIPSGGILRLKLKDKRVKPTYLTLVLNSLIVKEQINRDVGGSVILHWRPDQVKQTLIPILDEDEQEQIQKKITESFTLRKQSKHLLECAKKTVEIAIEKSEEEAEIWLKEKVVIIDD